MSGLFRNSFHEHKRECLNIYCVSPSKNSFLLTREGRGLLLLVLTTFTTTSCASYAPDAVALHLPNGRCRLHTTVFRTTLEDACELNQFDTRTPFLPRPGPLNSTTSFATPGTLGWHTPWNSDEYASQTSTCASWSICFTPFIAW